MEVASFSRGCIRYASTITIDETRARARTNHNTHTHTRAHAHTHTYSRAHMHTYIHTCTNTDRRKVWGALANAPVGSRLGKAHKCTSNTAERELRVGGRVHERVHVCVCDVWCVFVWCICLCMNVRNRPAHARMMYDVKMLKDWVLGKRY
jgi:hypothetical protein